LTPKIVDKDERRGGILGAATRVFGRKGYHATRVADIAREAGVAQGTVYLYFGSRDEILMAAFEAFAEGMAAGVGEASGADGPALDRLRSVVHAVLSSMEAEPELSKVMLDFWSSAAFGTGESGEGRRGIDLEAVYAEYRRIFGGLLEEAGEEGAVRKDLPADAPAVIVGAIEGVLLQWLVDPGARSPAKMAEPILDVLLDGLVERRTGR
jgi:TetR/AcrR family transcriptional regulator, fatty acid metabolism regulator protein